MIIKKCNGCGSILQDNDANLAGYTPKLIDAVICQRCFRIKHYNELPKIVASNEDYLQVINAVVKRKALMVFIVDIFNFKATFNDLLIEKLKNKDVILVINKVDLLPKSSNLAKITEWASNQCAKKGFKVLAIGVTSAKKGSYIDELIKAIDLARKERDVYFIGCANVGKSSIINALLRRTTSANLDLITTSIIPGTTLKEIRVPYFIDNQALVDTPGLINEKDILNQLFPTSYRTIIPSSEIRPVTFQMLDGNSLFIAGLACLSFTIPSKLSVTVYCARSLYLHRCKTSRVEELFNNQLGLLLIPPTKEELEALSYTEEEFKINGKKTLWFSGFGFIIINGKCNIRLKRIVNTEVYITDAIIG